MDFSSTVFNHSMLRILRIATKMMTRANGHSGIEVKRKTNRVFLIPAHLMVQRKLEIEVSYDLLGMGVLNYSPCVFNVLLIGHSSRNGQNTWD